MTRAWSKDRTSWAWFCAWAAAGGGVAIGAIALGPVAFLPALVGGLILASGTKSRRSAFGLLSGIGISLLVVAWVQRSGPGETCWHTSTASGCSQHLDPLPWLVGGIVLFAAGLIGHMRRS